MCPGVNSASKKWVPGIPLGVKVAGACGWRPTTLVVPNVKKSGALTYPEPLGPSRRPVVGETFTFTFTGVDIDSAVFMKVRFFEDVTQCRLIRSCRRLEKIAFPSYKGPNKSKHNFRLLDSEDEEFTITLNLRQRVIDRQRNTAEHLHFRWISTLYSVTYKIKKDKTGDSSTHVFHLHFGLKISISFLKNLRGKVLLSYFWIYSK